ncbi:TRAP transporter substrate-binding protein [Chloroflexota bacterium]
MKKVVYILLALILVSGVMLACGDETTQAPAPEPTTAPAPAPEEPIVWKYTASSPDRGLRNVMVKWYFGEIEARTNGRFTVEYFWNGTLAQMGEEPDVIKANIAQTALFDPGRTPEKMPMLAIEALPLLGPETRRGMAQAHVEFIKYPAVAEEFANLNAVELFPNSFGQIHYTGNSRIDTVADLKGLRIEAVSPVWASIHGELGAVDVALGTGAEIYDGLQKGIIDLDLSSAGSFMAYSLFEVSDYLITAYLTDMTASLVANKDAYNALPADIKAIFEELSAEALTYVPDEFDANEEKTKAAYKDAGREVIPLPDAVRAALTDAAKTVAWDKYLDEWTGRGYPAQDVLDHYNSVK